MTLRQIVADQYGLTTRANLPDFLRAERDSSEVSVHASPVLRGPYGGSGTSDQMKVPCLVRGLRSHAAGPGNITGKYQPDAGQRNVSLGCQPRDDAVEHIVQGEGFADSQR
jgi:hypothetical protein